ncbi:MAG: type II/IV secretion system ATPase subunit [Halobacteriota archaeon]|nr:type II/IV secretion system ATPase subunit [Halobacteriota archaeon]
MAKIFRRRVLDEGDFAQSEENRYHVSFSPPEGTTELERYTLAGGDVLVTILKDDATNVKSYHLVEPSLSREEKLLLEQLFDSLQDVLSMEGPSEDTDRIKDKSLVIESKVKWLLRSYGIKIDSLALHKILYYLERNFLGYERIDALMRDPKIEDISCDGVNLPIFLYHIDYQSIKTNISFTDEEVLNSFIIKLSQKGGRHISIGVPLVDAMLPDGSRLQATFGREVTSKGSTFTIRKFRDDPFTPPELIMKNTFSLEMMAYLWLCIENNKNLIFAGGTGSGKTSSLNASSFFIPPMAKIVSIEDTREITLYHENWIPGITREAPTKGGEGEVTMFDLLKAALRQRPEYIILGEVRGKEALTLFQAMNTGHTTYSTIHADDPQSVVSRLENEPINVPPVMLQALDIICVEIQTNVKGKRVRRLKTLVEIVEIDPKSKNVRINELFRWDPVTDTFMKLGESKKLKDIMIGRGWTKKELTEELERRMEILQWMVDSKIENYIKVSDIIQNFYFEMDSLIERIRDGMGEEY